MGFEPNKNIEFAYTEIKNAFDNGSFKNFEDAKYSNYKYLFSSKEMQDRVFIQGLK